MNVSQVLLPVSPETGLGQETGKDSEDASIDSLLFALFLNQSIVPQTAVTGQETEELPDDLLLQSLKPETENIFGPNVYRQILQDLFPAGKEANSGLIPEQSILNKLISNVTTALSDEQQIHTIPAEMVNMIALEAQDVVPLAGEPAMALGKAAVDHGRSSLIQNMAQSFDATKSEALSLKDSGFERTTNPLSGESYSLNPQELDRNIKIVNQLKDFSGQMELKTAPEAPPAKSTGEPNSNNQNILSTEKALAALGLEGKGQQNQSSGQENTGRNSSESLVNQQITGDGKVNQAANIPEFRVNEQTLPRETGRVWEQVLDILKKQELAPHKELKELFIQLHPAELGKIQVSMRMENGQLHLVMNASDQTAGTILQNNLQELKNGLMQMGVSCGDFQMGSQDQGKAESDREFHSDYSGRHSLEEEFPAMTGASSYLTHNDSGSRINVTV